MNISVWDIEGEVFHYLQLDGDESALRLQSEYLGVTVKAFLSGRDGGLISVGVVDGKLTVSLFDNGSEDPLRVSFDNNTRRWIVMQAGE